MELTSIEIGIALIAFVLGFGAGWTFRKPKVLTSLSPDFAREKTLFEAQHNALLEDMQSHLTDTAQALSILAERQQQLASQLRGEPQETANALEPELDPALTPPRDYADVHGQLSHKA